MTGASDRDSTIWWVGRFTEGDLAPVLDGRFAEGGGAEDDGSVDAMVSRGVCASLLVGRCLEDGEGGAGGITSLSSVLGPKSSGWAILNVVEQVQCVSGGVLVSKDCVEKMVDGVREWAKA